jgi:SAM-dependent methyltransferase
MKFFDLVNISERTMELVNPSSPEKIIKLGKVLGMGEGSRVIDFGCGFAEPLVLWAQKFGITGIGIDVREYACGRARKKIAAAGLENRIEIVCGNAAEYEFAVQGFDTATCIGASFIWGGFRPAIHAMRRAIRPGGRLGIGEPYWCHDRVPITYAQQEQGVHREQDLLRIAREEGFDFAYVIRASHDDWDRYESDNWDGLLRWLAENPDHPERAEVQAHLHKIQEEYLTYGREYLGWAMYALAQKQ